MKAWYVAEKNADASEIHWADTRVKAKHLARLNGEWVGRWADWVDIIAKRAPAFDGEPRELTPEDWRDAGYGWYED